MLLGAVLASQALAQVSSLGDAVKGYGRLPQAAPAAAPAPAPAASMPVGAKDEKTNASGIREALAVGTERAVKNLAQVDGYFGNPVVRIPMPASLQKVADVARVAGFQQPVDDFVLRMNRAAEAAVPLAARHFGDAIREMSFSDVRGILTGGETAATDFFRARTHAKLYAAFKPIVAQKVGEAGATRAYQQMMSRYEAVPLVGKQSLDLEVYVSERALDGLYRMVAAEERKIRSDPLARTSDLLKAVFGR